MTASDIQIIFASIAALLLALGGGVKWLLVYVAGKQAEGALSESKARSKLSERLYEEIRVLRLELANSHAEKQIYLRRIFQLEAFIHSHEGIELPVMDGWPPL